MKVVYPQGRTIQLDDDLGTELILVCAGSPDRGWIDAAKTAIQEALASPHGLRRKLQTLATADETVNLVPHYECLLAAAAWRTAPVAAGEAGFLEKPGF